MGENSRTQRFLFLNSVESRYVAGDAETHKCYAPDRKEDFLCELTDNEKIQKFCTSLNDIDLPNRDNLFFILAALSSIKRPIPDNIKHDIFTTALNHFKNDDDVFSFVRFMKRMKKNFPTGVQKIITAHYKNKEPKRLVKDFCKRNSYHSWKHKDVIKLCHIKSDDVVTQVAFTFAICGVKAAEKVANMNETAKQLVAYMKNFDTFKKATDISEVESILEELEFNYDNIPHSLLNSTKVWESLLTKLDIRQLLPLLVKMYKRGLLKNENPCQAKVIEIFNDDEKIKECNIHPLEVYMGIRLFEKGGKPRDIKLIKHLEDKEGVAEKQLADESYEKPDFAHVDSIKCPPISHALVRHTLKLSYQNVEKTGKRFLITISAEADMDRDCLSTKYLTCLEAAAILTLSILNAEDNVTVAVFNDATINKIKIDKSSNMTTAMKKLRQVEHGKIQNGAPLDWALINKKPFDVFINFHYDMPMNFRDKEKPINNPFEMMSKYQNGLKLKNTRMLFMNLGTYRPTVFPPTYLDIRGIDDRTPSIMYAYIKNLF